jgi:hypothetical protein
MSQLRHWESVKTEVLGLMAKLDPGVAAAYRESLESYKEIDWYGFQRLPIMRHVYAFVKFMEERGGTSGAQAKMLMRVMLEEFYALVSYQSTGCRIIRPSPALVRELVDTEVTFKLAEIRPPWPFVYIALPRESGLVVPHYHSGCAPGCDKKWSACEGLYVTWAESGAVTKAAKLEGKVDMFTVDEQGKLQVQTDVGVKDLPTRQNVTADDVFGDWFARFLAVACDGRVPGAHNYSVHYFNMHWGKDNAEDAEGAFARFENTYSYDDKVSFSPEVSEVRNRFFHLAANIFLYMSMPQEEGDTVFKPSEARERYKTLKDKKSSKWRRNMRERIFEEMPTEEWVIGQTVRVVDRTIAVGDTGSGTSEERGSPRTHWRRAHWTTRWLGPRDGERRKVPRWLRAVLVRGQGEAPESTTYVVGKERT